MASERGRRGIIDRAIGAVAPGWALGRERARLKLAVVEKTRAEYDGATFGRRSLGWRRSLKDANTELNPRSMAALRGVSRDLVRNNPFASRAIAAIANNLVGTGITFQVYRDGKIDTKLNELARRHFDTTACDADGKHDLYGLQLQAARAIVEGGAVLCRRRWRREKDGLPLPFQLQLLEPDYIEMNRDGPVDGGFIINGIEFDAIGRRKQYWLRSGHPGSLKATSLEVRPIPAKDIIHCFRADRPEQQHGAPWLSPVVLRMRDFAEFEDARIMREKIAACFSVFTTDENGEVGDSSAGSNGQGPPSPYENPALEVLEPGIIEHLPPGRKVEFANPPRVEGYMDFSRVSHRAIAAGLGIPYETLTGDLSGVSFISGRLGRLEWGRNLATWQWAMFIPQFCGGVEQFFLDAAAMAGEDVRGVTMEWTPPRLEMMDPASEVPAIRDGIRSGLMNLSEGIRERGIDPDRHFAERAADNAALDRLEIVLDSDPRKVTSVGNAVNNGMPTTIAGARQWLDREYPGHPGNEAMARQLATMGARLAVEASVEKARPGDPENASAVDTIVALLAQIQGEGAA